MLWAGEYCVSNMFTPRTLWAVEDTAVALFLSAESMMICKFYLRFSLVRLSSRYVGFWRFSSSSDILLETTFAFWKVYLWKKSFKIVIIERFGGSCLDLDDCFTRKLKYAPLRVCWHWDIVAEKILQMIWSLIMEKMRTSMLEVQIKYAYAETKLKLWQ